MPGNEAGFSFVPRLIVLKWRSRSGRDTHGEGRLGSGGAKLQDARIQYESWRPRWTINLAWGDAGITLLMASSTSLFIGVSARPLTLDRRSCFVEDSLDKSVIRFLNFMRHLARVMVLSDSSSGPSLVCR